MYEQLLFNESCQFGSILQDNGLVSMAVVTSFRHATVQTSLHATSPVSPPVPRRLQGVVMSLLLRNLLAISEHFNAFALIHTESIRHVKAWGAMVGGLVGGGVTGAMVGGLVGGGVTGAMVGGLVGGGVTGAMVGGLVGGGVTGAIVGGLVGGGVGLGVGTVTTVVGHLYGTLELVLRNEPKRFVTMFKYKFSYATYVRFCVNVMGLSVAIPQIG